jgi:peptide-N4-(N-acetyl-beta-glucosaminyl)asparagine amidase
LLRLQVCDQQTRFVRYTSAVKLLETRTGRCGEWANCFLLVLRAAGFDARHIYDFAE